MHPTTRDEIATGKKLRDEFKKLFQGAPMPLYLRLASLFAFLEELPEDFDIKEEVKFLECVSLLSSNLLANMHRNFTRVPQESETSTKSQSSEPKEECNCFGCMQVAAIKKAAQNTEAKGDSENAPDFLDKASALKDILEMIISFQKKGGAEK